MIIENPGIFNIDDPNVKQIMEQTKIRPGCYVKYFKSDLATEEELAEHPNLYKYRVICIGKDTNNCEDYVVYSARYNNPTSHIWIRKASEFFAYVNRDKYPDAKQTYVFELDAEFMHLNQIPKNDTKPNKEVLRDFCGMYNIDNMDEENPFYQQSAVIHYIPTYITQALMKTGKVDKEEAIQRTYAIEENIVKEIFEIEPLKNEMLSILNGEIDKNNISYELSTKLSELKTKHILAEMALLRFK